MPTNLSRFTPMALSCLLLTTCLVACAKADTIETLDFTGIATCGTSNCSSFGSGSITGTYNLDLTTQTIVGAWSFSTPYGVTSSSDPGAVAGLETLGADIGPYFEENSFTPPGFFEFVALFYPGTDTQETGALASDVNSEGCNNDPGTRTCFPDYVVTGTTTLVAGTTTPEPSSLMLLGIGLAGLSLASVRSARKQRRPKL